MKASERNKLCKSTDLSNEASVESFFVNRMLAELGYQDSQVRLKEAIEALKIPRGRAKEMYRPDYLLVLGTRPRWLIDAKGTEENVDDWTHQCAGYALLINRKYEDRPLRFYMVTNGLLTRVYQWDQEEPVLSLRFSDVADGNPKFEALKKLLAEPVVRKNWSVPGTSSSGHRMTRPPMTEVKRAFTRCHQFIWKAEKMSPQAAFLGFAKLLFVKLWEDRKLRDDPVLLAAIGSGDPLPAEAVRFSIRWIERQSKDLDNPVDRILFRQLHEQLETEIQKRRRKRIFSAHESLGLSPGTVKRVVEELEHFYLFGIDEDLNGRMFESFLTATMRGKALGQYFTPRGVVKLMTKLARPEASRHKVERVLDACCGTGGFLIEVLTDMRAQVNANLSLAKADRERLLNEVANEAIFGIDAGREPPLARIARINMYLHGDGGTRVYTTDSLRPIPKAMGSDTIEVREEVEELRSLLAEGLRFDVVVTNPPFSMSYSDSTEDEKEILGAYELCSFGGKRRPSLSSTVMFLERYWNLLKPGGRLLTVLDDTYLGSPSYAFIRQFIRERFIVRGVVSLPGDCFQAKDARVKTSILMLQKRVSEVEEQPSVFVYECRYIGLEDVNTKTPASIAEAARGNAKKETGDVLAAYEAYMDGRPGAWLVPAGRIADRLDAKQLTPWSAAVLAPIWKSAGASTEVLENIVEPIDQPEKLSPDKQYTFLRVTYSGRAAEGEKRLGRESTYRTANRATPGDLIVSHINAVNKAVCVIPSEARGFLVSTEYTILRLRQGVNADTMYLWSVLRSDAVVAEWLGSSTGGGRSRVGWDLLRRQRIPFLPPDKQRAIGDAFRDALDYERKAEGRVAEAYRSMAALELDGEEAKDRLEKQKPPR